VVQFAKNDPYQGMPSGVPRRGQRATALAAATVYAKIQRLKAVMSHVNRRHRWSNAL